MLKGRLQRLRLPGLFSPRFPDLGLAWIGELDNVKAEYGESGFICGIPVLSMHGIGIGDRRGKEMGILGNGNLELNVNNWIFDVCFVWFSSTNFMNYFGVDVHSNLKRPPKKTTITG